MCLHAVRTTSSSLSMFSKQYLQLFLLDCGCRGGMCSCTCCGSSCSWAALNVVGVICGSVSMSGVLVVVKIGCWGAGGKLGMFGLWLLGNSGETMYI